MTADMHFAPNFSWKQTHPIFSPFKLCNTARPSQQQLSSVFSVLR